MYVYETTNTVNNKKYIGVKVSKRNYENYLGSGILLNRAIKKYGKDKFIKVIIKEFEDEMEARNYERELIDKLGAIDSDEYYNLVVGGYGGGVRKCTVTEETKKKISKTKQENPYIYSMEEREKKSKEVLQYNLYGEYIKTFPSKYSVEEFINSNISGLNKKEPHYRNGYIWLYKDGPIKDKIKPYSDMVSDFKINASKKSAKLTENEVISLVRDKEFGLTYKQLSEKYNVSPSCAYEIVVGKTYKWVWGDKI